MDAPQHEHPPALRRRLLDQLLHSLQLAHPGYDPLQWGRLIGDVEGRHIGHIVDAHDLRAPHLLQDNVARGLKEVGPPAANMVDAVQLGQAAVGFLDYIFNVLVAAHPAPQPCTHVGLMRQDVTADPRDDVFSRLCQR